MERTIVLIKPDGVERKLVGEILQRFEKRNFRIVGMKIAQWDKRRAENFYSVHKGKPFLPELVKFMTSGPLVALCLEGSNAIKQVRKMIGALDPLEAQTGSIRGDYTLERQTNLVHGSDSQESVNRELPIVFSRDELLD